MDLNKVETLARATMDAHGLHDWSFKFDRAVQRAGSCQYRTKTITLSRALMVNWSEDAVRNTVLHEVAHAIAGHRAGHGPLWRAHARRIGCTGTRCWTPSADAPQLPPKFVGVCPTCERRIMRDRRTRIACSKCCRGRFNAEHLFVWEVNVAA